MTFETWLYTCLALVFVVAGIMLLGYLKDKHRLDRLDPPPHMPLPRQQGRRIRRF